MNQPDEKPRKIVSREEVYDAAISLWEIGKHSTRERLSDIIDIPPEKLDEHLRMLKDAGRLRAVERGVFEPVFEYRLPRPISKTILQNGYRKVEVGDLCMELTPQEARNLGIEMAGEMQQYGEIQSNRENRQLIFDLGSMVRELRKEVASLKDKHDKRQLDLLAGPEGLVNTGLIQKSRKKSPL